MKLLFVVNPISGGVNKEPFLEKAVALCNKYNLKYHIFRTTGKNDHENLKTILPEIKPDKVIVVGGDGTILFTGLALLGTNYPIGIIPLGSANGMAAELNVNNDPIEAFKDILMSAKIEHLDILKVNDNFYSIHIGDVGINARIVEAYDKDPNRGMITYAKYFLDELRRLEPFSVKLKANGKTYNEKVYMAGICNARKFGTGVPLNLEGNPMDGKFEIVLVTRIDATALIKAGLAKFNENFFDNRFGKVISTEYAELEFKTEQTLQLDGEVAGKFKKIKVEILKSAIHFITHSGNEYAKKINPLFLKIKTKK